MNVKRHKRVVVPVWDIESGRTARILVAACERLPIKTDPEPITILFRVVQSANDFFDHTRSIKLATVRNLVQSLEQTFVSGPPRFQRADERIRERQPNRS